MLFRSLAPFIAKWKAAFEEDLKEQQDAAAAKAAKGKGKGKGK